MNENQIEELNSNKELSVTNDNLPALYRAADRTSVDAQKQYLLFVRINLVSLVLGSVISAFNIINPLLRQASLILGAIIIAIGLILTIIITIKEFERKWYGGRAAAESIKSLTWLYMMCAEPFSQQLSQIEVDKLLTLKLFEVLDERNHLALTNGELSGKPQITELMRKMRTTSIDERREAYISQRIQDQRRWYSDKSKTNEKFENLWFLLVVGAQTLALISALLLVAFSNLSINPTGVFLAAAASFIAWMQIKQHQTLSQSYAVTAHELGLVLEQALYAKTEEDLSRFVSDAESAISREHTMWIARRRQTQALF